MRRLDRVAGSVAFATGLALSTAVLAGCTPKDETTDASAASFVATAVAPSDWATPSDPLLGEQWAIPAAGVDAAWSVTGGAGVTVAVVDTGVDLTHPDLVDNLVAGWDAVDDDADPQDLNGHGTHVAGIVAAAANDIGTAGVAPQASIMPVRVLDADGAGSDDDIAEGIVWAVDNGGDVINLSLGQAGLMGRLSKGGPINRAIRYATDAGVIVVAASGNEGEAGQQYRVGVDALVVNASGPDGELAEFSNVGDVRSITAPGVDILSTAPAAPTTLWPDGTDGTAVLSGTSMATPLVSGAAALLLASGVPADEVVAALTSTATGADANPLLGVGRIDVAAALGLDATPQPTASAAPAMPMPSQSAPQVPTAKPTSPDQPGGSVTLSITVPRSLRLTTAAPVECAVDGRTYTATTGASGQNASVQFSLTGAPYRGPGDVVFAGTMTATLGTEQVSVPIAGKGTVGADLSGSLTIDTDDVALSLTWICG